MADSKQTSSLQFHAATAWEIAGKELTEDKQITIESITQLIPVIIDKMEPKAFFQWFCPFWQTCEFMYIGALPKDWIELVNWFTVPLTTREDSTKPFTHPTLRAMCVSYILASLGAYAEAQAGALRVLVLYATRAGLSSDQQFVSWLLKFMKDRIDTTLAIKENRDFFIETIIGFFNSMASFDITSLITLIRFFEHKDYIHSAIARSKQPDIKEQLQNTVLRAFVDALNAHLMPESEDTLSCRGLFIFEVFQDTAIFFDNLDQKSKELLAIIVSGTIKQFEDFVKANDDYIKQNKISIEEVQNKVMVLAFVSSIEGKKEISFDEAASKLGVDHKNLKRIVVQINSIHVATIRIDAVEKKFIIEHSQPRTFGKEEVDKLNTELERLVNALSPAK